MKRIIEVIALTLLLGGCALLERDRSGSESLVGLMSGAERAYADGEWLAARDGYLAVVERVPDHVPALFRLANIAHRLNSMLEARARYEQVLDYAPEHAKAHYNLAIVLAQQAESHYARAAQGAGSGLPSRDRLDHALGPQLRLNHDLTVGLGDAQ